MRVLVPLMVAGAIAVPAQASVSNVSANGFEITQTANLVVPQEQAFAAFGQLPRWWSKQHTYSGDSANIRFETNLGGCFCERWDKGSVEFMRVVYVVPGEQLLLRGALGPMLFEPVNATLEFKVDRIAGGAKATLTYKAYGFSGGNAAQIAPAVDGVLADAMKRYRSYAAAAPKGSGAN